MIENILSSSIVFIAFIVIGILIYFLLNMKNLNSKKKYYEHIHTNLEKGKKVEFSGGIYGKIYKINNDIVEVEISKNVIIEVSRYAISRIVE